VERGGIVVFAYAMVLLVGVLAWVGMKVHQWQLQTEEQQRYEAQFDAPMPPPRDMEAQTEEVPGFFKAKEENADLEEIEFHEGVGKAAQWW
jgi:hypothetical protein